MYDTSLKPERVVFNKQQSQAIAADNTKHNHKTSRVPLLLSFHYFLEFVTREYTDTVVTLMLVGSYIGSQPIPNRLMSNHLSYHTATSGSELLPTEQP